MHRLARTRHTRRPLSQSVDQRDTLGVLWGHSGGTRGDGCRAAAASRGSSCPRRSGRCRRDCVPRDHATAPSAAPPMRARSSSSAQRYPRRRSCDAIGCDGCRCAAARAGALRSLGQSSPTSRLRRGLSFRSARTTSCHSADVRPAGRSALAFTLLPWSKAALPCSRSRHPGGLLNAAGAPRRGVAFAPQPSRLGPACIGGPRDGNAVYKTITAASLNRNAARRFATQRHDVQVRNFHNLYPLDDPGTPQLPIPASPPRACVY